MGMGSMLTCIEIPANETGGNVKTKQFLAMAGVRKF